MATTASGYGYGCCSAGLPPFALLPGILSTRRSPPPPRVSLVASPVKSFVPSKVASFLLRRGQFGRAAVANGISLLGCLADYGVQKKTHFEATIDIKLPRRSLPVQFTCNACGERTKRLINRVAYERGSIFIQCAGCQVYHKFVDNLGLVVEYDLGEENELQGENVVNPNSED